MKPHQILIFFIILLVSLSAIMSIFPEDGIKISDNFSLQFASWKDFSNKTENTDITNIVENNQISEDTIVFVPEDLYDTMYIDSVMVIFKPVQISVDSTLQPLEFPADNDTLLNSFFATLGSLANTGEKIHILHYGDSQIEVDRMTSYIRKKLQNTFGGYGCGFHTGIQAFDFKQPLEVTYSDNWFRYKMFPRVDTTILHKRYGITTAFTKFIALDDSTNEEQSAWIQFGKSVMASTNARKYSEIKLYYGHNSSDISLDIMDGENTLETDILPANENLQIKTFYFDNSPDNVKFVYTGTSSPEIYGYSFESQSGVIVDNLPVRGSSGLFFGRMDFGLAGQIFASMNVRLILMQFGGNAVTRDSSGVRQYVKYYKNELKFLKTMAPNTQIIVIGPADMSVKDKNNYITNPHLPYLIEEMRKTALENDCAFWNMYEAMGGENSMPSWVFHDPPLAIKDFVHFTPQGANIVAQMFYKALMLKYNQFIQQNGTSK